MSSVRMCDKCGCIFSENDDGWSTFSGTAQRRHEDGSRYTETVNQDACAKCTSGVGQVAPRLAIPATSAGVASAHLQSDMQPDNRRSRDSGMHPDYARIAELERENGIGPATMPVTREGM